MPLAGSFQLSKKKGNIAAVFPKFDYENKEIEYTVKSRDIKAIPKSGKTARGAKFKCILCGGVVEPQYVKDEGVAGRMGAELMAVVAEGERGRIYLSPTDEHRDAAEIKRPENTPTGSIGGDRRALWTPLYGLSDFSDLFTNRQLTALTTFSALVGEAQQKAEGDAEAAGMFNDHISISEGGTSARAYGEAVGVYLAMLVDKQADLGNSLNRWEPNAQCPRQLFARQAIPMVWDFAEANVFSTSSGSWEVLLNNLNHCLNADSYAFERDKHGFVRQFDAQSVSAQ